MVFRARSPLDYAAAVMDDLVEAGVYAEVEATRVRSLAAAFTEGPRIHAEFWPSALRIDR